MEENHTTTVGAPLSLKERQRQEREQLILQAAEVVLAEHGYHDASMDAIAARVGIAKGTLYLHFPSKDDLVVALFAQNLASFREAVEQIAAQDAPARARLERILLQAYSGLQSERRQLFLSLYASASVRKGVIEKQLVLRQQIEQITAVVRAVLEQGQAAGEFDRAIPVQVLLATFLPLLSPRVYKHLFGSDEMPPETFAAHVARIFFRGILP